MEDRREHFHDTSKDAVHAGGRRGEPVRDISDTTIAPPEGRGRDKYCGTGKTYIMSQHLLVSLSSARSIPTT